MKCVKFTKVNRNTLIGYADLEINVEGMAANFRGIALHSKEGKKWINFPARKFEKEGETKWVPDLLIIGEEDKKKFNKQAIEEIERKIKSDLVPENDFPHDDFVGF